MKDRSAVNTIRGYFYQFDYSIIKLLELENDSDSIVVEGIEDIDIYSASDESAIQCKYYENTEYNHSVIAPAIRLMLVHHKSVIEGKSKSINYKLYGHYKSGQEKLVLPLSIEFLKNKFLTYTEKKVSHKVHEELSLEDKDLSEFLTKLTIELNASSFEIQESKAINLLMNEFSCNRYDAEILYYCGAINKIRNTAIQTTECNRRISRSEFINAINVKQILFDDWYISFKGKEKWLLKLRMQYFTQLNNSPFERFFLLEITKDSYSRSTLKEIVYLLHRKWSKLSKRENQPFCPYLYIHGIDEVELIEIKKELHADGFFFIDGYDYMGACFNPESIVKIANYSNQIKIKFINSIVDLEKTISIVSKTKEIYQFYFERPFYLKDHASIKQVSIQIQELSDVKGVV